jgi:hypothetical protein
MVARTLRAFCTVPTCVLGVALLLTPEALRGYEALFKRSYLKELGAYYQASPDYSPLHLLGWEPYD